ncbi:O-methyltransferase-domain-containing protein [Aspergillus germanicus]
MQVTTDSNDYLRDIQHALQSLTGATERCQLTYIGSAGDNVRSLSTREAARRTLVLEAYRFLQTAQGPVDAAATCYEQPLSERCLRCGFFDELPADGSPRKTRELATRLGVEESLLAHLKLHELLTLNSWHSLDSTSNNPYTHAHQTNGKTMFANLSTKPDRLKAFNDGMTVQAMTAIWMIDLFPFHQTFTALDPRPGTVLAVDIGGGRGKAIARIRDLAGDVRGRFILQDQAHVIAGLQRERGTPSTSYLDGIETMAHDFFTEQPVHGALVYLIRRCLHNWPEDRVVEILKNTAAAMESGHSRLLIEEIIVPVRDSGVQEGWIDLIMMAVLGKSGLELTNVYQVDGYCHGLIEARVAG